MAKSLYILVHATFHKADEEKRESIYECLEEKGWTKITDNGLTTTWACNITTPDYEFAFDLAEADFNDCANRNNTKVNFIVQVGPSRHRKY